MPAWLAGAMLGLSVCFRITPVIAAPVMYFYMRDFRKRIAFLRRSRGQTDHSRPAEREKPIRASTALAWVSAAASGSLAGS